MKNLLTNETGTIIPLVAIFLPLVLLVGVFVAESGHVYIRQAELHHLAYQGAQAGLIAFSDIIRTQAETNYAVQCNGELPPDICTSDQMLDFVSQSEIAGLLTNETHLSTVNTVTQEYLETFDPHPTTTVEITIAFPFDISTEKVFFEVEITDHVAGLFPGFFIGINRQITASRQASLRIQ